MRHWKRAPSQTLCGLCRHRTILQDEPALYIKLDNVKREMIRCQDCAGEAPPDLPANLEPGGIVPTHIGFTRAYYAAPKRTRGALRAAAEKYTPYNS